MNSDLNNKTSNNVCEKYNTVMSKYPVTKRNVHQIRLTVWSGLECSDNISIH
jgi:hypothetical protein